jgi:hypothetical protein
MEHGEELSVWNLMQNVVAYFNILSRNFFGVAKEGGNDAEMHPYSGVL